MLHENITVLCDHDKNLEYLMIRNVVRDRCT